MMLKANRQAWKVPQNVTRLALIAVALATSLTALPESARATDQRDFQLVNDSPMDIHEVYVSSVQTDDWEEDVLGQDILAAGNSVEIKFEAGVSGTCFYDLKVVTGKRQSVEVGNVNLCQSAAVIFDGQTLIPR